MRTTLILDDDLVHAAKQRALDERTTFSAIVNRALREHVGLNPTLVEVPYRIQTFGEPSQQHPSDTDRICAEQGGRDAHHAGLA